MKKVILITLFLGIITCLNAQDSIKFPYKNAVKISPFDFANKTITLNYERGFGNSFGINLSGGLYYYEKDYSDMGLLGEIQFRYYFSSKPYKDNIWDRFFFAPYAFARQYQISDYPQTTYVQELVYPYNMVTTVTKKDYTINSFGGGTIIGYSLAVKKFSLELFLGGGIKLSNDNLDSNAENDFRKSVFSPAYRGIVLKGGFNLGFFL